MKKIHIRAQFKFSSKNMLKFRDIAEVCITRVQLNEKGALQYDWFFNDNGTECVVLETYADSDAVLAHVENVGQQLSQLFTFSDVKLEIYGQMSDELQEAVAGFKPIVYSFFGGLEPIELESQ